MHKIIYIQTEYDPTDNIHLETKRNSARFNFVWLVNHKIFD